MRLIDADALLENVGWLNLHGGGSAQVVYSYEIYNAPIIDAAPVVHGEWMEDKYGVRCSACGRKVEAQFMDDVPFSGIDMPYCLHCGAKMEEET